MIINIREEIEWKDLFRQKVTLYKLVEIYKASDPNLVGDLEGIIHLLEQIQDGAVNSGEFEEKEVFPPFKDSFFSINGYGVDDVLNVIESSFPEEDYPNLVLEDHECELILKNVSGFLKHCTDVGVGWSEIESEIRRYLKI